MNLRNARSSSVPRGIKPSQVPSVLFIHVVTLFVQPLQRSVRSRDAADVASRAVWPACASTAVTSCRYCAYIRVNTAMRTSTLGSHAHNALLGVAPSTGGRFTATIAKDGVIVYDVTNEVSDEYRRKCAFFFI